MRKPPLRRLLCTIVCVCVSVARWLLVVVVVVVVMVEDGGGCSFARDGGDGGGKLRQRLRMGQLLRSIANARRFA